MISQLKFLTYLLRKLLGSGGSTDPGDVQGMFRCYIEGCVSVRNIGDRWMVGLEDLAGLF